MNHWFGVDECEGRPRFGRCVMGSDILKIDLASQSFMHNPFPTLTRLREAGPVVRLKLPFLGKSWAATTYEAASEVLKDERTFVRNAKNAGRREIPGVRWWMSRTFRVVADWSLAPSAVEELLRVVDVAQTAEPRLASRDLEFHGQKLARGEMITPMLASANIDPARFHDPGRLDVTRSPNPHLAFGSGVHFCSGA